MRPAVTVAQALAVADRARTARRLHWRPALAALAAEVRAHDARARAIRAAMARL